MKSLLTLFNRPHKFLHSRKQSFIQAVFLILLVIISIGLHDAYNLLAIGVSYKAKILCSGTFVSRRDPQSVLNNDLEVDDLAVLRFIDAKVDRVSHQVSASFLGLISQQVVYRAEQGCTLVYDGKAAFSPPFAKGEALGSPVDMPVSLNTRFDAALDWAFAEPDSKHLRRTRAVVIVKDGKIAAERYAPGFSADMPLPGWSLAKSVTNALVGVLVGQGRLDLAAPAAVPEWRRTNATLGRQAIQDRVGLFQGEVSNADPRSAITLDHLMRMVSGLEFSESAAEPLGDVTRMLMREPDAAAYAASKPLAAEPGMLWHYASGSTNIISRIIRQRLGEAEYREFPQKALFGPLGMGSARLETDASGTFIGSSFVYATARDWAKFGQLYLQDGVWQARRILPPGWVAYSTAPTLQAPGRQYAAHFWLNIAEEYRLTDPGPQLPPDAFHALGYEGQCVSMIPSQGLVIVRLGLTRTSSAWRQDRFIQQILMALTGA